MLTPMEEYTQSLYSIKRQAAAFFTCGLLCVIISGVLITTRSAVSQQLGPQIFQAPFRVVNSSGQILFEVKEHPYGGKMVLYARGTLPIIEASSGEMTTGLAIHQPGQGGTTYIGANTKSGFVILEAKGGRTLFKKP